MNAEFIWTPARGPAYADARRVRLAVFCDEQGFSRAAEFDGLDESALHIVSYVAGEAAGTARVLDEGAGVLRIGRFAVLKPHRGSGLGAAMLRAMIDAAKHGLPDAAAKGGAVPRSAGAALALGRARHIVLGAQADKTAFYGKAGFRPTGETHLDEGMPHVDMELWL